jgi:threonine aldolase
LLALENTQNGKVMPQAWVVAATALAHERGLSTHLDGARFFNAAVKSGVDARSLVTSFDSVSICLSKGLGAPAGSVLLGNEHLIRDARRWRKVLGGAMRQVGILAAAGLYALEHHVTRLEEDHRHAALLAEGLRGITGLRVEAPQTNMVWVDVEPELARRLVPALAEKGVLATGSRLVRFVTHLDVSAAQVREVVSAVRSIADD